MIMTKFLKDNLLKFKPENIVTVIDGSFEENMSAMDWLQRKSMPGKKNQPKNFFFYISGHGCMINGHQHLIFPMQRDGKRTIEHLGIIARGATQIIL